MARMLRQFEKPVPYTYFDIYIPNSKLLKSCLNLKAEEQDAGFLTISCKKNSLVIFLD
jgi:hypothetical protein